MYVTDNYDLSLLYLHVELFLACMCMVLLPCVFHVWLTLRMLSVVVGPHACCSNNVSCVSNLSYCYGDKFVVRGVRVPAEGPTTLQLQHVAQSWTVTEKVRSHD